MCSVKNVNSRVCVFCETTTNICVYDYEKIFTDKERNMLSEIIKKYKELTKKEILVITTPSIGDFSDIQEYANNIGSTYSIDVKNENVVTLAISKKMRKIGIATSPRARKNITDQISLDIIREIMIPEIKQGFYYNGVRQGINEIIKKWNVKES